MTTETKPEEKKSPSELLDEVEGQISDLEDRRKELLFEVAKEVAKEEAAEEVQDAQDDAEEARKESTKAQEAADYAEEALAEYGSHTAECLQGALAGSKALHPLCTCGWNDVATEIERW